MAEKGAEVELAELKSKISELEKMLKETGPEAIRALQDRLESLENMMWLEQAGRLELKKALEELALPAPPVEVEDLREKIRGLEIFKSEAVDLLKALDEKVGRVTEVPTRVTRDVELLKKSFDEIARKVIAVEQIPEKVLEESRKSVATVSKRIDAIEKSAADLGEKLEMLRSTSESSAKEFSKLLGEMGEGITELSKKVEVIPVFDERISSLKELSEKNAKTVSELGGLFSKLSEKSEKEVGARITTLSKDVEVVKSGQVESATAIKKLGESVKSLEKKIEEVSIPIKEIEEMRKGVESVGRGLEKLGTLETRISGLDGKIKDVEKVRDEISALSSGIEQVKEDVQTVSKSLEESLNRLRFNEEEIERIGGRVGELEKIGTEMRKIVTEVKKLEPEEVKKIIDELRAESRKSAERLRELISLRVSPLDAQLRSLSERIVLVEARIAALERLLRERVAQPVIIE